MLWLAIVVFGFYLAVAVVVTIVFAVNTDNKDVHPGTAEYALYKNTMFKDCYDKPALDNANCTAIEFFLQRGLPRLTPQRVAYMNSLELYDMTLRKPQPIVSYSWCQVAGCFNDSKVVPSLPRSAAFWEINIRAYTEVSMILMTALWQILKLQNARYADETEPCNKIEWDIWVIQSWELVSTGW